MKTYDIVDLELKTVKDLRGIAKEVGVINYGTMKKPELCKAIINAQKTDEKTEESEKTSESKNSTLKKSEKPKDVEVNEVTAGFKDEEKKLMSDIHNKLVEKIDGYFSSNDEEALRKVGNLIPEEGEYSDIPEKDVEAILVKLEKFEKERKANKEDKKSTKKTSSSGNSSRARAIAKHLVLDGDNAKLYNDGKVIDERDNSIWGKEHPDRIYVGAKYHFVTKTREVVGEVVGIFNGKYEKDFTFVVRCEDKKDKWVVLRTVNSIKLIAENKK